MKAVNKVYWTENDEPKSEDFEDDLPGALLRSQALRATPGVSFVVIATVDPHCVSLGGVSPAPSDYNWRKRRSYDDNVGRKKK